MNSQHISQKPISPKRVRRDRILKAGVVTTGMLVLLLFSALIWQLFAQSFPLLQSPKASLATTWQLPDSNALWLGDISQHAFLVGVDAKTCRLQFYHLANGQQAELVKQRHGACDHSYQFSQLRGETYLASLNQKGQLRVEKLFFGPAGVRSQLVFSLSLSMPAWDGDFPLWQWQMFGQRVQIAIAHAEHWQLYQLSLSDVTQVSEVKIKESGRLLLLPRWQQSVLYTHQQLALYQWNSASWQRQSLSTKLDRVWLTPSQSSLQLLFANGEMQKWSLRNHQGVLEFVPHYTWQPLQAVRDSYFIPELNAALFLLPGQLSFYNLPSAERISYQSFADTTHLFVSSQGLLLLEQNQVQLWQLHNMAGIASWKSLWGKVWYEGYQQPEYVWQSASGDQQQAAKYSLMPLLMGSIKAAVLAILVAVPIALTAAVYSAFFAAPKVRNLLKPAIETLEAIPSVLIGFIAALWLTPAAESFLIALIVFILLVPVSILLFSLVSSSVSRRLSRSYRFGYEIVLMLFLLLGVAALVFSNAETLGSWITGVWPHHSEHSAGLKSALVVAVALGIAIAPSIYALAEEAIYSVPNGLKEASFALGATHLQTLRNIVLLVALPGILSAVTLGFGRAVGETMIILMVTGNSPIADWSFLVDLRAMTANLAIELPKAHVGSVHYHVLFFSALLLFLFTFLINALAEFLRSRLRKQYPHV